MILDGYNSNVSAYDNPESINDGNSDLLEVDSEIDSSDISDDLEDGIDALNLCISKRLTRELKKRGKNISETGMTMGQLIDAVIQIYGPEYGNRHFDVAAGFMGLDWRQLQTIVEDCLDKVFAIKEVIAAEPREIQVVVHTKMLAIFRLGEFKTHEILQIRASSLISQIRSLLSNNRLQHDPFVA